MVAPLLIALTNILPVHQLQAVLMMFFFQVSPKQKNQECHEGCDFRLNYTSIKSVTSFYYITSLSRDIREKSNAKLRCKNDNNSVSEGFQNGLL